MGSGDGVGGYTVACEHVHSSAPYRSCCLSNSRARLLAWKRAMPAVKEAVPTKLARALAAREQITAADEPPAHWAISQGRPGAMFEKTNRKNFSGRGSES